MLKNHMLSHRNVLTEEQMAYAIHTSASFADEIAAAEASHAAEATADAADAADAAAETADEVADEAAADTADAPVAPDNQSAANNEGASTSTPAALLRCAVCRKTYHYPRALQTHLTKSGHGQVAGINVVAAQEGPVDAQDPGRYLKEELDLVAHLLNPFNERASLMDSTPQSHMDGRMTVTPHISDDFGTQLDFARTLEPIGLPQFDNKAADFLFYEYMVTSRALANAERHKVISRLHEKGPIEPGQCFFCRKKFDNERRFYMHGAECSKLGSLTCQYCDMTFNHSMSKTRHMPTCEAYRACAAASLKSGETPEAHLARRKKASDFVFYLLRESLFDPAMRGVSLFGGFSLDKYNEWLEQNK
jgi:uncharacterized C2H2 Zn-finger protein